MTEQALPYLRSGAVIKDLMDMLVGDVVVIVNDIAANLNIDTGIAFSGLWKTAIDSQTCLLYTSKLKTIRQAT